MNLNFSNFAGMFQAARDLLAIQIVKARPWSIYWNLWRVHYIQRRTYARKNTRPRAEHAQPYRDKVFINGHTVNQLFINS